MENIEPDDIRTRNYFIIGCTLMNGPLILIIIFLLPLFYPPIGA